MPSHCAAIMAGSVTGKDRRSVKDDVVVALAQLLNEFRHLIGREQVGRKRRHRSGRDHVKGGLALVRVRRRTAETRQPRRLARLSYLVTYLRRASTVTILPLESSVNVTEGAGR